MNDYILNEKPDICAITETWLTENDTQICNSICPDGFEIFQKSRNSSGAPNQKRGGGVAVVLRNSLGAKIVKTNRDFESFEHLTLALKIHDNNVNMAVLYRPPSSSKSLFLNEFSEFIVDYTMRNKSLVICGDFNLNFSDKNDFYTKKCIDILDMFDLVQNVTVATHQSGNTLDWIITKPEDIVLHKLPSADILLSDHFAVNCVLSVPFIDAKKKEISYRKTKNIDIGQFKKDMAELSVVKNPPDDLDNLVNDYNTQLRELLNDHAPVITKRISSKTANPWYDQELRDQKRELRQYERRSKDKLCGAESSFRLKFKTIRNRYNELLSDKKADYFNTKISENEKDQKCLFKIVNNLQNKSTSNPLPDHSSQQSLANSFASYFKGKIDKIVDSFTVDDGVETSYTSNVPRFGEFRPLSFCETEKLIQKSANKSCSLDPIPTFLVKACVNELCPVIRKIVNTSLEIGKMPRGLQVSDCNSITEETWIRP